VYLDLHSHCPRWHSVQVRLLRVRCACCGRPGAPRSAVKISKMGRGAHPGRYTCIGQRASVHVDLALRGRDGCSRTGAVRGRVSLGALSALCHALCTSWRLHASRRPVSVTARLAADRLMVPAHHRHRTQCALSLYNRECALCSPDARRFSASDLNAPHALSQLYVIWLQIRIL
jgi:hypothetical protein